MEEIPVGLALSLVCGPRPAHHFLPGWVLIGGEGYGGMEQTVASGILSLVSEPLGPVGTLREGQGLPIALVQKPLAPIHSYRCLFWE